MRPSARALALALPAAFGADLLIKAWAESALELHRPVPVAGELFRLTLGENRGITFGFLGGGGAGVFLLTGAIILVLAGWTLNGVRRGTLRPPAALAAGAALGGALANFADRVGDGAVTDFLDFGIGASRWPAFNLADACIVVGALALGLLVSEKVEEKHG